MNDVDSQGKGTPQKSYGWKILILLFVSFSIVFVAIEITLRIIGYGSPYERIDPFQGFQGTNRIFQEVEIPGKGHFYEASPNKSYINQRFPAEKTKNVYRIFTFGGSTTEGVPWGRDHSFSAQLQQSLQERIPSRDIEVINVGVAGFASSRVLVILREMLDYQPDLFVVYTGQNEFRDAHFHKKELHRSSFWANVMSILYRSRTIFLISERTELLMQMIAGKRIVSYAAESIEAVVRQPFTRETFQSFDYYRKPDFIEELDLENTADRDESKEETIHVTSPKSLVKWVLGKEGWQNLKSFLDLEELSENEVYGIFEENIQTMIELANSRGVKIVFVAKALNPKVTNLQYPYRINPQTFIKDGKVDEWKRLYSNGIQFMETGEYREALGAFQKVRTLYNPSFRTRDHFLELYIGECYERLGDYDLARREYEQRLPISHKHLNTVLHAIADEKDVQVLDAQHLLEEKAEHGIVGYNLFLDSMHMTLAGYKIIGLALADYIATHGLVSGSDMKESKDIRADDFVADGVEENIAEKDFPSDVFTGLGWSAFNQGKFKKAYFWGQRAVSKSPKDVQAHLLLGYVHAKQGNEDGAKKEWEILKHLWTEMETH